MNKILYSNWKARINKNTMKYSFKLSCLIKKSSFLYNSYNNLTIELFPYSICRKAQCNIFINLSSNIHGRNKIIKVIKIPLYRNMDLKLININLNKILCNINIKPYSNLDIYVSINCSKSLISRPYININYTNNFHKNNKDDYQPHNFNDYGIVKEKINNSTDLKTKYNNLSAILYSLMGKNIEIEIQDTETEILKGKIVSVNDYTLLIKKNNYLQAILIDSICILYTDEEISLAPLSPTLITPMESILKYIKDSGIVLSINDEYMNIEKIKLLEIGCNLLKVCSCNSNNRKNYIFNTSQLKVIKMIPVEYLKYL